MPNLLAAHNLNYISGHMHMDGVSLEALAGNYGTPAYVYSANAIRRKFDHLNDSFRAALPPRAGPMICYACKANSNIHILSLIREMGGALEIVSEGELVRGLKAGFKGEQIVSTGVGKTHSEIRACLQAGIRQFNVESLPELERIARVAADTGLTAPVAFRLNPDVAAGGDNKIMTGRARDKFGMGPESVLQAYASAGDMAHVRPVGLSMHIGSQIHDIHLFRRAYAALADCVQAVRDAGYTVERLDIGGGFGITYESEVPIDPASVAEAVAEIITPLETELMIEPGRFLVGNSGILLTRVEYVKQTHEKRFLVLDAAMNDLIRPALYDAWHGLVPVKEKDREGGDYCYDLVGPVCETGDTFARDRMLPEMAQGDLAAFLSAGAYAASMASNYNTRPLLPEILVEGDAHRLIRRRQDYADLLASEDIS